MGAAALGRCHPDASAALAYVCGTQFPQLSAGSVVSCASSSASALTLSVSSVPSSCSGTCAPVVGSLTLSPGLPACDESDWLAYYPLSLSAADGGLVAAAVASVWLAAAAWKYLRAALHDRGSEGL